MSPAVQSRSFSRVAPVLVVLASAGCGLTDYENKMELAEARLQRFDDENRLLGDPLFVQSGEAESRTTIFLRPPKGVSARPGDQPGDLPYHYSATGACTALYLMFGTRDDDKGKLEKQIENWRGATGTWQPYTAQPPNGRPAILFDAAQFPDPPLPANAQATLRAYVRPTANGPPVAVLFRIAQPTPTGADEAVKMSLETFADSGAALNAKGDYDKWRSH